MAQKTFPGVFTTVVDQSFTTPVQSQYRPGLIGVATKGPLNVPTAVRSLKEFRRLFGEPVSATHYLADAAAILSDLTDGTVIVRVGDEAEDVADVNGSGDAGSYTVYTSKGAQLDPANANLCDPSDSLARMYVTIKEAGKASTVNARVVSTASDRFVLEEPPDGATNPEDYPSLSATYAAANVSFSYCPGAINVAESKLSGYTYTEISAAGLISGSKNAYRATITGPVSSVAVGNVYKITQTNKATTHEIRIKEIQATTPVTLVFEPADVAEFGYKQLSLQDSYTAGAMHLASTAIDALFMEAATPGTWANGTTAATGLHVGISPGSKPGTKKLEVYENAALVETFDNLSESAASTNYYTTRINGLSGYIVVSAASVVAHPANTVNAWNAALTASTTPKMMPVDNINNGGSVGANGSFRFGANGANAGASEFVGGIDPTTDLYTGLKAFKTENFIVDTICAPMDNLPIAVAQEIALVANSVNSLGLADIPKGLNARAATDWHNGEGIYAANGKIDSPNLAFYWNWFTTVNRFANDANVTKALPPSIGAMRAFATTFDNDRPWFAAAGETRGLIPEALSVEFETVSPETKAAMYGDGNSVNPILLQRGRIMVFGERTSQRAESKLTAVHSVHLVNYIVKAMAIISRQFVFDPNDAELLLDLKLALTSELDQVRAQRGMEEYNLVIDETNNNADSRNRREVNVDLYLVPVDTVERIFINAVVRESGASLNNLTT